MSGGVIGFPKKAVNNEGIVPSGFARLGVNENGRLYVTFPNGVTSIFQGTLDGEPVEHSEVDQIGGPSGIGEDGKIKESHIPDNYLKTKDADLLFPDLDDNGLLQHRHLGWNLLDKRFKGNSNGYVPLGENGKIDSYYLRDQVLYANNKELKNGYAGLDDDAVIKDFQLPDDILLLSNNEALRKMVNNIAYPVGSVYMNFYYNSNPNKLLGVGRWEYLGEGNHLVCDDLPKYIDENNNNILILAIDDVSFNKKRVRLDLVNIPLHRHIIGDLTDPNKVFVNTGFGSYASVGFKTQSHITGTMNWKGTQHDVDRITDWGTGRLYAGHFTSSYQTSRDVEDDALNSHSDIEDVRLNAIKAFIWFRLPDVIDNLFENNKGHLFNEIDLSELLDTNTPVENPNPPVEDLPPVIPPTLGGAEPGPIENTNPPTPIRPELVKPGPIKVQ